MADRKPVPTSPKVQAQKELEKLYSDPTAFDRPAGRRVDWITSIIVGLLSGVIGAGGLLFFSDELGIAKYLPSLIAEKEVIIRETQNLTSQQVQMEQALNAVRGAMVSIYPKEPESAEILPSVHTPFDHRGTGVVLTSDGLFMTTSDVLQYPEVAYVAVFSDGTIRDITDVVVDPADGLVFGRVDASNLAVATFANRGDVRVGDDVFLIDRPPTSSSYHVRSTTVSDWSYRTIHSDEDIPVFSDTLTRRVRLAHPFSEGDQRAVAVLPDGKVLGFVKRVDDASTLVHVPYRSESIVRDVVEDGEVDRPSLGVAYYDLSDTLGLPSDITQNRKRGAVLFIPDSGRTSAAASAGLRDGDLVLSVNGDELTERVSLSEAVLKHAPAATIPFVVLRDGVETTIDVKLD